MPPEAAHYGPMCCLAPPPSEYTLTSIEDQPKSPGELNSNPHNGTTSAPHHDHQLGSDADDLEPPPPLLPQFFYSSSIPIDDPLSPGTNPNTSDPTGLKGQLRPFSRSDSNVLEKAWRTLTVKRDRETHRQIYNLQNPSPEASKYYNDVLVKLIHTIAKKHFQKHGSKPEICATVLQPVNAAAPISECCTDLWKDIDFELRSRFCALLRRHDFRFGRERVALETMNELRKMILLKTATYTSGNELIRTQSFTSIPSTRDVSRGSTPFLSESLKGTGIPRYLGEARVASKETMTDLESRTRALSSRYERERERSSTPVTSSFGSLPPPQLRSTRSNMFSVPSSLPPSVPRGSGPTSGIDTLVQQARRQEETHLEKNHKLPQAIPVSKDQQGQTLLKNAATPLVNQDSHLSKTAEVAMAKSATPSLPRSDSTMCSDGDSLEALDLEEMQVSVGLSRLHVVNVAELIMKPIYWSPVNDLSPVMRATWFYKDTMMPVSVNVANQLEAGYRELRAWSETWQVELSCAVEIGAAGEEKISYPLWPQELSNPNAKMPCLNEPRLSNDIYCAIRCFYDEAAAEGALQYPPDSANESGEQSGEPTANTIPYTNHHVIYRDSRHAFILKPSLKPSAYYSRRPIARILKGVNVGVPVIRGFDREAWEHLYEKSMNPSKSDNWAASSASDDVSKGENGDLASADEGGQECPACFKQREKGRVTDLVLVAHGIGQKFAKRVESFHFTHAINSFRRAVNIELQNPSVKSILRPEHNGIMILPLNWRHSLSFGDDGSVENEEEDAEEPPLSGQFGLKDIEPPTIPAVRSIISDVMFDIPFYMSHHKSKMISALVSEANRVYRLWCRNNPGFLENGRVHILGHSLGSAMALDILSRQPNYVPKLDLSPPNTPSSLHFEFDTCNLILCGSPSAFFLLLERGTLIPRRGHTKPGTDQSDFDDPALTGEAGKFGCLAVENVYNILAKEDPIAYLLTGTIDPAYAASLKTAYLPSTTTSFFRSVGNTFKGWVPGTSSPAKTSTNTDISSPDDDGDTLENQNAPPSSIHLPSQLELEIHDFTREEVAEKKALLLNDNGQIDWYLRGSGGPLEIQYLNMLSAHTSYWKSHDFIRFLCVEIGRRPGRKYTMPEMRARKALKRNVEGTSLGAL
ncbi:putative phospholipase [Ceratocystis fimbriata CBS 114723]|uniref:Putative phospholipase n=1 Tax=Ceratocystis fimbriata CBS 114723 TaxID=1035309 RepID=A0A2C5XG67_9PEZI|nr:putative phospholipase [Ceratocystis fimbriata CBS 114723]